MITAVCTPSGHFARALLSLTSFPLCATSVADFRYRTSRGWSGSLLLVLFSLHIFLYFEYRTPAIFHVCETGISQLDHVLHFFSHQITAFIMHALFVFNLPRLETRRDIAMLGILHKAALKLPSRHLWQSVVEDRCHLHRSERYTHNTSRVLHEVLGTNRTRLKCICCLV